MLVAQTSFQERNPVPEPANDDGFVALILPEKLVGFFLRVYGSARLPSSIIHGNGLSKLVLEPVSEVTASDRLAFVVTLMLWPSQFVLPLKSGVGVL